jgi:hypothetical protein
MNDSSKLEQYLSANLELTEDEKTAVSELVAFFGIDDNVLEYTCNLKKTLFYCIEKGMLDEIYVSVLEQQYFANTISIRGITMSHAIFSFNYLSKGMAAYKYYFYELTTLLNRLKDDKESFTVIKLYGYSNSCRKFLEFVTDNITDSIYSNYSLREVIAYIRKHYSNDENVLKMVGNINALIYETYRASDEKFIIENVSQQSADGNQHLEFMRRIGYHNDAILKTEMEAYSQETIMRESSDINDYSKFMSAKYKSAAIQKSHISFISNANTITLCELRYLHDLIADKANDVDKRICARFLFFSAFCGVDLNDLLLIFCGKHEKIKYNSDLSALEYKTEKSKKQKTQHLKETEHEITIEFPTMLSNIAFNLYCFCTSQTYEDLKCNIDKQYAKIRKEYRKISSLQLTEKRISNFFNVYFTQKYMLDELIADYISCKLATHTVTKQHYVRFTNTHLISSYTSAFNKCLKDLHIQYIKPENRAANEKHFGSTAVVEKEFVVKMFDEIREIIKTTTCERTNFNFASFYIYTLMKLSLGIRPLILPVFNEANTSFETKFTIIRDKKSKNYIEFRNLPVCSFICKEFKAFKDYSEKYFSKVSFIIDDVNKYGKNDTLLFMLNENNKPTNFSKANINEYIYSHMDLKVSHLPANFLRHYFRTYLSDNHFNSTFMDFLMGHNLEGQEMLNRYSSLDIIMFRKRVIKAQERIIKEHKIESLFN